MWKKIDWESFLFYAIVAIAYYVLIRQYIPVVEDLYYPFVSGTHGARKISCFQDVLESQAYDYVSANGNGRFVIHSIVQSLCAIQDKRFFYLVSTFFFVLLIRGIVALLGVRQSTHERAYKYLVLLLLAIVVPLPGLTVIGHIAFVVNYLWTSTFVVWFLYFFSKYKDKDIKNKLKKTFVFLGAVFVGCLQESFSLGIAAYFGLFYIIRYKRLMKGSTLLWVVGFLVGTCFVVFAPSNFARFVHQKEIVSGNFDDNLDYIHAFVQIMTNQSTVSLCVCLLAIFFLINRRKALKFINENSLYVFCLFFCVLFAVIVAYTGAHQLMCAGIFSTLLILKMLSLWENKMRNYHWLLLTMLSGVTLIGLYIPTFQYRQELNRAYNDLVRNLREVKGDYVSATALEKLDRVDLRDSYFRKYTDMDYAMVQIRDSVFLRALALFLSDGTDRKTHVMTLPDSKENIQSVCTPSHEVSDGCFYDENLNYYVVKKERQGDGAQKSKMLVTLTPLYLWGKVKDKIQHREQGFEVAYMLDDVYPYFKDSSYSYFIYRDESFIIGKRVSRISVE